MSTLESLHFSTEHRHPTVIEILLRKLERKCFDIIFSWVPGHVGIHGNEQTDTAARSMSDHMQRPVCYQDLKTSTQNYIHRNYIHRVWQETWDQHILNKLHNIHPSTSHWAAVPVRRHDVRLTRLRIGHTRFTHRHLLLAIRGLLATGHVILNHGQVSWMTPELAPPSPNYHTTPTWKEYSLKFTLPRYMAAWVVLDESRSFFRVHTSYFSNIPKCIKAEFIASWACSQSSVVSSSKS
ncbi:RNA-directed DNA polymerase from mobile element jockey [Trichonephila clavipes]|nr:RNA-directed DNA polymerase from mobile element jockey [Trichonephila clavipes]